MLPALCATPPGHLRHGDLPLLTGFHGRLFGWIGNPCRLAPRKHRVPARNLESLKEPRAKPDGPDSGLRPTACPAWRARGDKGPLRTRHGVVTRCSGFHKENHRGMHFEGLFGEKPLTKVAGLFPDKGAADAAAAWVLKAPGMVVGQVRVPGPQDAKMTRCGFLAAPCCRSSAAFSKRCSSPTASRG